MKISIRKAVAAVLLFFCLVQVPLEAQQGGDQRWNFPELVAWAYGQDQELVNGLQYYDRHPKSLGHPYLLEGLVHQGSVNIRGKVYDNLWLKYDIYAQQVEVEYRTMGGADNQVILVNDRVENFSIGNYYFERLMLEEEQDGKRFYQVLGEDPMVIYIRWDKKLVPTSGDPRFIEEYTAPKRDYFLDLEGSVHSFNSRKSLVKLFPESSQKEIKRLIKGNQILLRNATPEQLELFILAANKILETTD